MLLFDLLQFVTELFLFYFILWKAQVVLMQDYQVRVQVFQISLRPWKVYSNSSWKAIFLQGSADVLGTWPKSRDTTHHNLLLTSHLPSSFVQAGNSARSLSSGILHSSPQLLCIMRSTVASDLLFPKMESPLPVVVHLYWFERLAGHGNGNVFFWLNERSFKF